MPTSTAAEIPKDAGKIARRWEPLRVWRPSRGRFSLQMGHGSFWSGFVRTVVRAGLVTRASQITVAKDVAGLGPQSGTSADHPGAAHADETTAPEAPLTAGEQLCSRRWSAAALTVGPSMISSVITTSPDVRHYQNSTARFPCYTLLQTVTQLRSFSRC